MKFIVLVALLSAATAHARDFKLTDACKEGLQAAALQAETSNLQAQGETLASKLDADVQLSYWPDRPEVTVMVRLEDALVCKIPLMRKDSSACRYSRSEGSESLAEIRGIQFKSGRTIKAGAELSKLEQSQVRMFLDNDGSNASASIRELIEGTDDRSLSTGTLTYLGAYGGDNPFGMFFKSGTAQVAGTNGDGSVCIK
jgi:hypothetical protein